MYTRTVGIAKLTLLVVAAIVWADTGAPTSALAPVDPNLIRTTALKYLEDVRQFRSGESRHSVEFYQTCERAGMERHYMAVLAECYRIASDGKQDDMLVELLSYASNSEPFVKDAALRALSARTPKLQRVAARWCSIHRDGIDDKTVEVVRRIAREWADSVDVDENSILDILSQCATKEDIPLVRKLLDRREEAFWKRHPKYGCWGVSEPYREYVRLLCRLGDHAALWEVADALTQTEDPEKRAWAILMAARLWPRGFYAVGVANALSDKAVVPAHVAIGPPPGVSPAVARFASVEKFTRVCDVAVRAIFGMEPPKTPWAFAVPTARQFELSAAAADKLKDLEDGGHVRSEAGAIYFKRAIGFPDENIKWTREYARQCQEHRLARAGAGPAMGIAYNGWEDDAVKAMVGEYVRAGQPVRLLPMVGATDAASLGIFVGERQPDLLLLGDKPDDRVLQDKAPKWTELNPAEYMIAGRAAAIIVNPANKLESLTMDQVRMVFSGEIDDWAAFGQTGRAGPVARPGIGKAETKINRFGLKMTDPVVAIFSRGCLQPVNYGRVTLKKDSNDVIAAVGMDPQAIGFVDLTACSSRPLGVNSSAEGAESSLGGGMNVKVLAIQVGFTKTTDGTSVPRPIRPTEENIRNAMYPLSQRLYLYVHPKASDVAKDFVAFMTSSLSSEVYGKYGLISLADAAIERRAKDAAAAARAAAAKAEKEKAAGGKATKKPAR